MNRYTIYCTEEQTKKDFELGAPIERGHESSRYFNIGVPTFYDENDEICRVKNSVIFIPTAEEMIGWLENVIPVSEEFSIKQIIVESYFNGKWNYFLGIEESENYYNSRKEATLAAIDAALEYLSKAKEEQ